MAKNVVVTPENLQIGDRVVRGRDWCYGHQDGNSVGVIVGFTDKKSWVRVHWSKGSKHNAYCVSGSQDLYFDTKTPTPSMIQRLGHLLI